MKYIALLRGINVGGKSRVEMARLRQVFEELGFADVSTYINSGNVLFASAVEPDIKQIRQKMTATFRFAIPTLVIDAERFVNIATAIPKSWENNYTEQKSNVVFLFPEVDSPDIITQIGYRPDIETMIYIPGALLSNVSRQNQSKSSLLKIVGTPLYANMTIRNITTVRKLGQKV